MLTYNFDERENCPLYEFLYRKMKEDILQGNLKANEKLPSKRSLARHLEISVITVENAYAQLLMEGIFIPGKSGGTMSVIWCCPIWRSPARRSRRWRQEKQEVEYFLDLKNNSVPAENFPFTVWSRLMRKVLADRQVHLLERCRPRGLGTAQGHRGTPVPFQWDAGGSGSDPHRGGDGVSLWTVDPIVGEREVYGVENPGYRKISQIYQSQEVACEYISLDAQGLSVSDLEHSRVNVLHISPGHHFPTGIVMPIKRRQELLQWAKRREDRYIIEDDYDSEFRFQGRPIQPLQSIDDQGKVIYMNTFSKTMAPSIRISYIVLPAN